MKLNSILIPPTLAMNSSAREFMARAWHTGRALLKGEKMPYSDSIVLESIEFQIERMVSNCAFKVWMPYKAPPAFGSPRKLKSNLSPSYRSVIKFFDKNDALWDAIESFLSPVYVDITKESKDLWPGWHLLDIFWAIYLLVSASRHECEIFLNPIRLVSHVDYIKKNFSLSQESSARMSRIRGLFSLYTLKTDIDEFRCLASASTKFRDRIDEILEDAYLLEASNLRTFFGYQANLASLKRDIRNLTKIIIKKSSWAKGIITATTGALNLAESRYEVLDSLNLIVDGLAGDKTAPVLIAPKPSSSMKGDFFAEQFLRKPFSKEDLGCVSGMSGEYRAGK